MLSTIAIILASLVVYFISVFNVVLLPNEYIV